MERQAVIRDPRALSVGQAAVSPDELRSPLALERERTRADVSRQNGAKWKRVAGKNGCESQDRISGQSISSGEPQLYPPRNSRIGKAWVVNLSDCFAPLGFGIGRSRGCRRVCQNDICTAERRALACNRDRKSTRLNSSHMS